MKEGGAEELQHRILVSGRDRVASGVWYGEAQVVIRVKHHGTDVSLDLVEQPAPIGGGETRLPDRLGVAPFKEVPDETFPAEVVLHLARTFNDGLHHLHSHEDPWAGPSSATSRWRATIRRRIESLSRPVAAPSLRKRPSNATIFALVRRKADDEKTPSKVRQKNPWWVKSTPFCARMCELPSRAQRMFTSSTGV